jgi:hypothetical protein
LIKFDKNPANHVKEIASTTELEMFKRVLTSYIHPEHELKLLVKKKNARLRTLTPGRSEN